jgi:hypothetical protein
MAGSALSERRGGPGSAFGGAADRDQRHSLSGQNDAERGFKDEAAPDRNVADATIGKNQYRR